VWVTNRGADTVSVIDAEKLEVTATVDSPGFPIRAAFTPDGGRVLVSNARAGSVAVFSAADRKLIRNIPMELTAEEKGERLIEFGTSPVPIGIVVTPDGSRAFVANTTADIVSVLDLGTLEVVDRYVAGKEPDGMAVVNLPD
jgi:YVTN family beta-propeller protein